MRLKPRQAIIFLYCVAAIYWSATPVPVCAEIETAEPSEIFYLASLTPNTQQRQVPHPAVVRVIAVDRDSMSLGSGTLVDANQDYGLIITNWHVVRDAVGPVEVVFADGFHSLARVVRTDKEWDLAALLIWKPPAVAPVPISTVPPRPGEMLTIAGYGKGDYKMQSGPCTEYLAPAPGQPAEIVELAAAARHGDSGGPILNSHGELAGVLFGEGGGRTDGSYGGRVNQFLQLTSLDLRSLPPSNTEQSRAATVAANSTTGNRAAQPQAQFEGRVAATQPEADPIAWSNTPTYRIAERNITGNASAGNETQPSRPLAMSGDPAQKLGRLDSSTPFKGTGFMWGDELKTFLAAFGIAAIVLHVLRWVVRG